MTQPIHAWMVRAGNSNELAELVEGRSPDHMTTLREAMINAMIHSEKALKPHVK